MNAISIAGRLSKKKAKYKSGATEIATLASRIPNVGLPSNRPNESARKLAKAAPMALAALSIGGSIDDVLSFSPSVAACIIFLSRKIDDTPSPVPITAKPSPAKSGPSCVQLNAMIGKLMVMSEIPRRMQLSWLFRLATPDNVQDAIDHVAANIDAIYPACKGVRSQMLCNRAVA